SAGVKVAWAGRLGDVSGDRAEVCSLWRKPARGSAMQPAAALRMSCLDGVDGDVGPGLGSPRQVLVTSSEDLHAMSLADPAARCNVVVHGDVRVRPGTLLEIGSAALRVTMR